MRLTFAACKQCVISIDPVGVLAVNDDLVGRRGNAVIESQFAKCHADVLAVSAVAHMSNEFMRTIQKNGTPGTLGRKIFTGSAKIPRLRISDTEPLVCILSV